MNNVFARILVGVVVAWLIFTYLLPLLPAPIHGIAVILLVLAAIYWLTQLV